MTQYEIIIFSIKYILCVILLFFLVKRKEAETLIKAIVLSFIVVSIASLGNLILQLTNSFNTGKLFTSFNFIDYLNLTMIINLILKNRRSR